MRLPHDCLCRGLISADPHVPFHETEKFGGFNPAALLDHERSISGELPGELTRRAAFGPGENTPDCCPAIYAASWPAGMVSDIDIDPPNAQPRQRRATPR
jgi:hypothetical protein